MTLKTIDIEADIYKKLLEVKMDDESISDVIERLLGKVKDSKGIMKFFGIWKDLPKEFFNIMKSDREEIRKEVNRRFS